MATKTPRAGIAAENSRNEKPCLQVSLEVCGERQGVDFRRYVYMVIKMTENEETRKILLSSRRFLAEVQPLNICKIGEAGPISFNNWDATTHERVRDWARGEGTDIPPEIQDYLDFVK